LVLSFYVLFPPQALMGETLSAEELLKVRGHGPTFLGWSSG